MGKAVIKQNLHAICDELGMDYVDHLVQKINNPKYQVRPELLYNLYNNKVKRVPLDSLAIIISTLNNIAAEKGLNKVYDVSDILKYESL